MKHRLFFSAALALMLAIVPTVALAYTATVAIHRNPSGNYEGMGMFEVQIDSIPAAGDTVISPTITMKAPAWATTAGSTSYHVLPLTIQVSTTTGPDTMHVGIQTSIDNGVTWRTDTVMRTEATSHYAEGTAEIVYLALDGEQIRLLSSNWHATTTIKGAKIRVKYPSIY